MSETSPSKPEDAASYNRGYTIPERESPSSGLSELISGDPKDPFVWKAANGKHVSRDAAHIMYAVYRQAGYGEGTNWRDKELSDDDIQGYLKSLTETEVRIIKEYRAFLEPYTPVEETPQSKAALYPDIPEVHKQTAEAVKLFEPNNLVLAPIIQGRLDIVAKSKQDTQEYKIDVS